MTLEEDEGDPVGYKALERGVPVAEDRGVLGAIETRAARRLRRLKRRLPGS